MHIVSSGGIYSVLCSNKNKSGKIIEDQEFRKKKLVLSNLKSVQK